MGPSETRVVEWFAHLHASRPVSGTLMATDRVTRVRPSRATPVSSAVELHGRVMASGLVGMCDCISFSRITTSEITGIAPKTNY
jgi:hypothetical protein